MVQLREAFVALNDLVVPHLAEHGHPEFRPAHGAVFMYLEGTGTTVSTLAQRAQMTKQAMAELVLHLELHGYVSRVPDPDDGRAKLVLPTERGRDVPGGPGPGARHHRPRPHIGKRRLAELRSTSRGSGTSSRRRARVRPWSRR